METLSGFNDLKAFLLMTDNDDPPKSFKNAQQALTLNNHTAPVAPNTTGNILGKPVAIFMVPDANTVGDFESLCLPSIHEKWPKAKICVPLFLRCSGALNMFKGAKWKKRSSVSKALARAAAVGFHEPDPYKGIGYLFRDRTLSVDHACFNGIAEFLKDFDNFCGI
jgi:hypothetical protein